MKHRKEETMKIKTIIDEKYTEPEIHICYKETGKCVSQILEELNYIYEKQLVVTDSKGNKCILNEGKVSRIFALKQKVYVVAEEMTYEIHRKLYELENELDSSVFIRISKSEIINMQKIKLLDMNTMGTIKVVMQDGTATYTSRRNVTRLKKALEGTIR